MLSGPVRKATTDSLKSPICAGKNVPEIADHGRRKHQSASRMIGGPPAWRGIFVNRKARPKPSTVSHDERSIKLNVPSPARARWPDRSDRLVPESLPSHFTGAFDRWAEVGERQIDGPTTDGRY